MKNLKLLMLFIFFTVFLQACSLKEGEDRFVAVNGQLDLTEWPIEESIISLSGQWDFYWNQLLAPTHFDDSSAVKQTGKFNLPGNWKSHSLNGEPLPKDGYTTLCLKVTLPDEKIENHVLGLRIPIINSNYNLWVDDQMVANIGQVGTTERSSIPQKSPNTVYFTPKNHTFTVTLQISNYHFSTGGMIGPIKLGKAENIQYSYSKDIIFQSIMLGVLILSGIYHIGLGIFRKIDAYFFYFGLFCLIAAYRYFMIGDVYFVVKDFTIINWEITMKLEYISFYSHVPLLAMVLYHLYPKYSSKWFTVLCIIVSIIYDLVTIVTSAKTYPLFIIPFQIFMIVCIVYSLIVVSKSIKRKQQESYYLLTGIVALMAIVLTEVIISILQFPEQNLYPIGIAVFIICFSLLLSKRLSSSLALSEEQAEDLSKLNTDLETKVEQRTKQIQQSNKKLEELNNKLKEMALVDGLTNIPNRRHFDEYVTDQYEKCMQEQVPLSILFFDIDYFKTYNDWYGHLMGDACLKQVAQTLHPLQHGLAARYGGEEFVCVLPNRDQATAEQIARELNENVEQLKIPHEKSPVSNFVTVSVGLTTVIPSGKIDKKDILHQADQALYQAKTSGRNRVVSYSN